jgi:PII-like signaling protein
MVPCQCSIILRGAATVLRAFCGFGRLDRYNFGKLEPFIERLSDNLCPVIN